MGFEPFSRLESKNMTQKNRMLDDRFRKGTAIHNGGMDCTGLALVSAAGYEPTVSPIRAGKVPFTGCPT